MTRRASGSPPDDDASLSLVCDVGGRRCAIALGHVVETMRPLSVHALSGAPPFVLGVTIIRGAPTPVVHVGRLLGDDEDACARFVLVRAGKRHIALAVDATVGVRALRGTTDELPPLLRDVGVVSAIRSLDAEVLLVLETLRLVPETTWATIDRGAHA